jgi:sphinganine-1-phosphate aldolase
MTPTDNSLFGDMHPYKDRFETFRQFPKKGRDPEEVYKELKDMADAETDKWIHGNCSGTMYHGGLDHYAYLDRVFSLYSHVNLLQRDMCPSGTKLEGEVIAMVAKMLNGDCVKEHNPGDEACGTITAGGSESIYNAMYVYREWGRDVKGIEQAEVVAVASAHPAFAKACHYLDMKIIRVPVGPDYLADVDAMRAAITPNTVALVGSAGNYPHGLIDPIAKLSDLALEMNIGLHVDGCLGGFILPWVERLGYPVPPFDFRNPGVTSMSCDTHKYGYALKGTSALIFRNKQLRRYQFFSIEDWAGGVYAAPTVLGSRSGGLSAAAWAAMMVLGEEGYLETARAIMHVADTIKAGVATIPELKIIGNPTFLISITSDVVNIYHVNDYLALKGWRMNGCQNPPAFHFCITRPQTQPGVAERYLEDLRAGVEYAKHPANPNPVSGALYGLAASPVGQAMLKEGMLDWIEASYEVE